jgi:hypothetical protein
MGANAQIAVPAFTAGQVLTAAQQTQINTGIPVFATTVTRDAAFGGTGEKVLAEGQFAYIEATNTTQYYDGAAWQNVGVSGLTYITQATPSAVSTVSINNCFSSSYENYLVLFSPSAVTAASATQLSFRLRVAGVDSSTNYSSIRLYADNGSVSGLVNPSGTDEFVFIYGNTTYGANSSMRAEVFKPFSATPTGYLSTAFIHDATPFTTITNGSNTALTSYDGFTVFSTATFSGTIRVYGYQNS